MYGQHRTAGDCPRSVLLTYVEVCILFGSSVTSETSFNVLSKRVAESENQGVDFDVTLQELIDWPHKDQPKVDGTREREKKLYNFRRSRCNTYKSLLEAFDNFVTEDTAQQRQISEWRMLYHGRLTSLKTEWNKRKVNGRKRKNSVRDSISKTKFKVHYNKMRSLLV